MSPDRKDEDGGDVLTPAGPRPRDQVQAVRPGETVRRNHDGTYSIVNDQLTKGENMADVDTTQALTPGGYRPLSMVYLIDPANAVRLDGEQVSMVDGNGQQLADLGTLKSVPGDQPLLPYDTRPLMAQEVPVQLPLGSGWIVSTGWTNNAGQPVSSFETTWIVPPAPATSSGQLIYLFNGMQNSSSILQPVLQWGANGVAGGGNFWSVSNWYVGGPSQPAFHGPMITVNPGDVLVGVMTLTQTTATGNNYSCDFRGLAGTTLTVLNVPELKWCAEALEAYRMTKSSDYPNVSDTRFTSIAIKCGAVTPTLNWIASNQVTDVGQHVGDIDNSATAGAVDLWYTDAGSWRLWNYDGTQADVLPGSAVARGQWHTIRDGHELIRMPDGKVLERVVADGSWWLWNYNPGATDVLPGNPVAQGTWSSIGSDHVLVPMNDGKILDWVPATGAWRLWNYDSTKSDVLPGPDPVATGTWSSVGAGHTLIPMPDGKVLDWVPADGTWRLWSYDPTKTDVLPSDPVASGTWSTINTGHVLMSTKDGRVLDWVPADGTWRLWSYDPTASDPLAAKVASGTWSTIRAGHALVVMSDGKVLDWLQRHP